jgi:hypothetical protein
MASLPYHNAVTTIQPYQINDHNMPLAKKVNLGFSPINIIRRKGIGTLLHSSHFNVLRSFVTSLHST